MTREHQKELEIMYAVEAGKLLGEAWKVKSSPDEAGHGSQKKIGEKKRMEEINQLATDYYARNFIPINANFLGDISQHSKILEKITEEVKLLSEWGRKRITPCDGCVVYILRLPSKKEYKRWKYAPDQVGWRREIGHDITQNAIAKKAGNLKKYQNGISDVRLLLVSDTTFNSGLDYLANNIGFDIAGFTKVYYLSYPVEAWTLSG